MRSREAGSWKVRSWTELKSVLVVSYVMLFLSSCATIQGEREIQSTRFEFALIGDMPYDGRTEKEFANVMKEMNAADLAFVVHNGDFFGDGAFWTEQARPELALSAPPSYSSGAFLRAVTRPSRTVWAWLKIPDIPSYWLRETTSGRIVTGQSPARMTRLRDWQNSARCFSRVIRASAGAPCG